MAGGTTIVGLWAGRVNCDVGRPHGALVGVVEWGGPHQPSVDDDDSIDVGRGSHADSVRLNGGGAAVLRHGGSE
jgi:hypothetical protein